MEATKSHFFLFQTLLKLIIIFFTAFIFGCSGGGDSSASPSNQTPTANTPNVIDSFDYSGLPPDPGEAGKATIEGIDSDADGVRDDVQRYIARTYADDELIKKAVTQSAKATQRLILKTNKDNIVEEIGTPKVKAMVCLWALAPNNASDISKKLKHEIINTKERLRAYLTADKLLSGTTTPFPQGGKDNCE